MEIKLEENKDLRQQTALRRLQEVSLRLLSQLEVEPCLECVVSGIVELLGADFGGIYRYDAERQELRPWLPLNFPEDAKYAAKPGEGMSGKIVLSGRPMKVDDYDSWEGRSPNRAKGVFGPVVQAPVRKGDEILGVLVAGRLYGKPPFTDEDLEIVELFASHAAVAMANAQLYQEAKRSASQLSSLYQTSLEITKQLDLTQVLEGIIQRAVELSRGKAGQFYLYDEVREELIPSIPYRLAEAVRLIRLKSGEGMSGKILFTRKPLMVNDYDTWEGRSPQFPRGVVHQTIGVPVEHGGKVLGVLTSERGKEDPAFVDDDIQLLTLFANQAAVAIANARAFEASRRTSEQLSKLYDTSLEMSKQLEISSLLEHITQRAVELAEGKSGQFYLYDEARQELISSVPYHLTKLVRADLKPGEGLSGRVFSTRQPIIIHDYDSWEGRSAKFPRGVFHQAIGIPVEHGDKVLGVLNVHRDKEDKPFVDEDIRLLTLFANQAGVALTNAQLYEETKKNAKQLTGLYETSLELASQLEGQTLLQAIVSRAARLLAGKGSELVLFDPQTKELRTSVSHRLTRNLPMTAAQVAVRPGEGVDGQVFATGQPLLIEDYNIWEGRLADFPEIPFPRIADVPIKLGNETLGTLKVVRGTKDQPFTHEDVRLLELFANQAAVAISNSRAYETSRRTSKQLSQLYDISLEITKQLEIPRLLERIIQRAAELANSRLGQIYLYDKKQNVLLDSISFNLPESMQGFVIKPGEGLVGKILNSRKPLIVVDYDAWEGRYSQVPVGATHHAAGVPVEHGGEILGVFWVGRKKEDPPFTDQDLQVLTLFANQASVALTNAKQYEELQKLYGQVKEKERLESELRVAHNIQASLLPQKLPKVSGWELAALWSAARVISGDFYDWFPIPGEKWGLVIADVAGKGIPAALFMANCRSLVRVLCMEGRPPHEAISRVNELILADAQSDLFVTLFHGVLDPKWGILTYVNAGHPRPIWHHRKSKDVTELKAEGIALGVQPNIELEEQSIQIDLGDLILFYTDGISEAQDTQGRFFGERRIRTSLKTLTKEKPETVLDSLQKEIAAFSHGREPSDDLTALIIKRTAGK